jgi:hypothetical protein
MNGSKATLNVLFEPVADCNCPKNCVRHGRCDECRQFHANAKRPSPPYCRRRQKPGLLKRLFGQ